MSHVKTHFKVYATKLSMSQTALSVPCYNRSLVLAHKAGKLLNR